MSVTSLKAASALEWGRFLDLAEKEARTDRGKALIHALREPAQWAGGIAAARIMQQETLECGGLLERDSLWGPLSDLADPEPVIERLGRGSVLEVAELALLRRWLYAVDSWAQVAHDDASRPGGELFGNALDRLVTPAWHASPLRALDRVLTPEGELSERASPRLAQLHQEIRGLRREIGIILDQLLKTFSQKGVLQENFTDVRDGRYVLPVKISNQGDVDGIIYEASASRQTVFVEPREVASLNNRLRQRQNELIQEIFVVLQETSAQIQPFAGQLGSATSILSHWDAVQARARLGRHYSGKDIRVTEERAFVLHQTAHPLLFWSLKREQIIRNELTFGEDAVRSLLLTGPNTGGKTVLLKTLGLAGICARTGFPFPGSDQPVVPFFDSFFADLGDPQSIEEHLSSFSGHVARFKEILANVDERSLVLIDELNSATDPEEGAALGRAFLETVMSRGALIVTTTHDPNLKAAAVADPRILNASMQFDEGARTPTYKMVLGVPGRSRALETAERLGIPAEVLVLARSYLSREHREFEEMLARLESDAREAQQAREEAVRLKAEAARLQKEWTDRTQATVNEMLDRTRQRLRKVLEQAQDEVRSTVGGLEAAKLKKEQDEARLRIQQTISQYNSQLENTLAEESPELAEALGAREKERAKDPAPLDAIRPGVRVRVPKWKTTGSILEVQGNKVKVGMGTLQMVMPINEVEPLAPGEQPKPRSSGRPAKVHVTAVPDSTLDLRGSRFDEAMRHLEQYLSQAYQSGGLAEVTIVHGIGTGALREGARKLLGELPYVKDFRDGGQGLGGTGATIVEFERN